MSSGRLARCKVGILRGCERVCSRPVCLAPAEVRGACMLSGSGGVYGCECIGAPGSDQAAPFWLSPPLLYNLNTPTHSTAHFTG